MNIDSNMKIEILIWFIYNNFKTPILQYGDNYYSRCSVEDVGSIKYYKPPIIKLNENPEYYFLVGKDLSYNETFWYESQYCEVECEEINVFEDFLLQISEHNLKAIFLHFQKSITLKYGFHYNILIPKKVLLYDFIRSLFNLCYDSYDSCKIINTEDMIFIELEFHGDT